MLLISIEFDVMSGDNQKTRYKILLVAMSHLLDHTLEEWLLNLEVMLPHRTRYGRLQFVDVLNLLGWHLRDEIYLVMSLFCISLN